MILLKFLFVPSVLLYNFCIAEKLINPDLNNVLVLTEHFFKNLNQFSKAGEPLDKETKHFIDNQISHYVELVTRSHGLSATSKIKRSAYFKDLDVLSEDFIGVYVLNGFAERPRIPVIFPKDIILFKHDFGSIEVWYAATLQTSKIHEIVDNVYVHTELDYLVIYRYEDKEYIEVTQAPITNGYKIHAHTVYDATYIVVAENHENFEDYTTHGSAVYLFNMDEKLSKIQTLEVSYPTDIAIWEDMNEIFMVISQKQAVTDAGVTYEVKSPVYKWLGKHFDIINYIDTYCAQKVVPFKIGTVQYLVVANYKNNQEETEIFSEILKYDIHDEKFVPYQKLFTHAAKDIKYFCFKQNNIQESFLVVANSHELDSEGNVNYQTNSVVYKYVEDYFMPFQSFNLNNAEQWLPVVGPNGEFILLVSCKDEGVKVFQYDGWRFIESEVQYTGESFGSGIVSMYFYLFYSEPIIVIANKNDAGNMGNVFTPTFNYQNVMNEFQDDMYIWCQEALKAVDDNTELHELSKLLDNAPSMDDEEIKLTGNNIFHNAIIDSLVLNDDKVKDKTSLEPTDDLVNFNEKIAKKHAELKEMEEKINNNNESLILNGDVYVKNLNVSSNDKIVFEDIRAKSINQEKMDKFFNEIIFLDDSLLIDDHFEFEDVVFDNLFKPKYVNNIPGDNYIFTSASASTEINLIVEGTVTVEELIVDGFIEEIHITENNVLLIEGDQVLEGSISLSEVSAEYLEIEFLNYIDITSFEERHRLKILETNITSLTVKNITVGFVNTFDMKSMDRLVLRTRGDQEIIGNYEFETLIVDEFVVDGLLSGTKVPDEFVLISNATHFVQQDLIFTGDLHAETLHVVERLNQIPVYHGNIDILLKDYPEMQYISGKKTFERLNLLGPIQLRGRIHSEGLDKMSPIITKKLNLVGDYTIAGDASIETLFKFGEITEPSGTYSMTRLEEVGLKLIDSEISMHMDLKQELNIEDIQVESINGVNIDSWIVFDGEPKEITGRKLFNGDLDINGETCILSINGNNLKDFYENTLHLEGDQAITGKHRYSNVTLVRAVSNNTFINNHSWDTVMTVNDNQYVNGTTIIRKSFTTSTFKTNSIEVRGKILDFDLEQILLDTVFTNTEKEITGHKYFQEDLIFNKLSAVTINNVNINKLLAEIEKWSGDVNIDGPLEIVGPAKINKLYFKELNGLKREDFGRVWLLKEGNQTVNEDQYFKAVHCNGNINTLSRAINNIDLQKIIDMAVRLDEKHKFNSAHFSNGVESIESLIVSGKVKDVNITDAMLSRSGNSQVIKGKKHILSNMTVYGYLHVNGLLSGINLTKLDQFINPSANEVENLIIDGNIVFIDQININYLNDYDLEAILKNAWFSNRETEFKGYVSFENVIFENEVIVDGYVDNVKLDWIAKNYFSKTKNQSISAKLDFTDGVIFAKDIKSEKGKITGLVCGIDIKKFNSTVLQKGDQMFNFDIQFDNIEVTGEFNTGLINGLNLSTDVMRSDVFKTILTGKKIIQNIETNSLALPKGRNIQNVNLDYWFKNAVLTNGTFTINGLKTFTKSVKFEQNVELEGLLNSYLFTEQHIMTTNTKQNIHNQKKFLTSENSLYMENIKVKGNVNDVNIDKLIQSRVDKTKNVDIYAPKNFLKNINASNVIIEQLYQEVDVSKLIYNITNIHNINTYEQEYGQLLSFAEKLLSGINHKAFFLDTFQVIKTINDEVHFVISMENEENILALIKMTRRSVIISIYNLINDDLFPKNEQTFATETDITFLSPIFFKNSWYLFLEENDNPNSDYTHSGTLYEVLSGSFEKQISILTNSTAFVTTITVPKESKECLLNIHNTQNYVNINCEGQNDTLELYQQLEVPNGLKASSIVINSIPYIFIVSLGRMMYESNIQIWKYNEDGYFRIHQILYETNPHTIDTVYYNGNYYLSVGLSRKANVILPGLLIIQKYNKKEDRFYEWQRIYNVDPIEARFELLVTNELVLYVITGCPREPLLVYIYDGISGFKKKVIATSLPTVNSISQFSIMKRNYITVSNEQDIKFIKALYKGTINE